MNTPYLPTRRRWLERALTFIVSVAVLAIAIMALGYHTGIVQ